MRIQYAAAIAVLTCLLIVPAALAAGLQDDDEVRGWTFDGGFRTFSSDSGLILKVDPSIRYTVNKHLRTYAGLPVYFTRESSAASGSSTSFNNGIGNAYAGVGFTASGRVVDYNSTLEFTAPTGDKSRGFSTGLYSVDWTNTFSHSFTSLMPYASAGIANTVSDTSFFVRPFTSHGLAAHFEGGSYWDVTPVGMHPAISIGGSGYAVRASGQQTIVSRVISPSTTRAPGTVRSNRLFQTQVETVGMAEVANDEGFSTWLTLSPRSKLDFEVGFSRSARYDLNSVFFGIGFRLGK